jgi:hypothetical protein
MTKDQLSAIRERLDGGYELSRLDTALLLDEVERLTTLLAGTEAVLENEREYQARLKAEVGQIANESFARGAEAMRTSLLQRVSWGSDLADRIRDEPVPEDQ